MSEKIFYIRTQSKSGKKLLQAVAYQYIDEGLDISRGTIFDDDISSWGNYLRKLNSATLPYEVRITRISDRFYSKIFSPTTHFGDYFYISDVNMYKAFGTQLEDLYKYGFNDTDIIPAPSAQV